MKAFIFDEKVITIGDNNGNEFRVYLINFKTYKDYFDHLPKSLFDKFKSHYFDLLSYYIQPREGRKIKDIEEEGKGGSFLQKKRLLK